MNEINGIEKDFLIKRKELLEQKFEENQNKEYLDRVNTLKDHYNGMAIILNVLSILGVALTTIVSLIASAPVIVTGILISVILMYTAKLNVNIFKDKKESTDKLINEHFEKLKNREEIVGELDFILDLINISDNKIKLTDEVISEITRHAYKYKIKEYTKIVLDMKKQFDSTIEYQNEFPADENIIIIKKVLDRQN